jgi:adenylate cyclase
LAAIMFTDMVGYTALGQRNESLSLALVKEQKMLVRPILDRHNGREVKTMGDAFLVEFPNALDAVRCAYDIQRATNEFNISLPDERRVHLRVGVHVGDVVESEGDISGDAVNVASRIEPLAEDGGVCLTRQVYDHVQNKFELPMVSIGIKTLKNVITPMEVFKLIMPWHIEKTVTATQLDKRRIAILPFVNMSPDPNDEYFADGLTEELISRLSQLKELQVIARTSVMNYKRKEKTAHDIGKELSAGTLVEGSVRRASNKIRVTVQLIDSDTEAHLWASNYDRQLDDIFAIQSDIAAKVAESLPSNIIQSKLVPSEEREVEDIVAYTYFLQGRQLLQTEGEDNPSRALELFKKAVEREQSFARGYVGIAECHLLLESRGKEGHEETIGNVRSAALKALSIDENLADAHAALSEASWLADDFEGAREEARRAIELNPSLAIAYWEMALFEATYGSFDEGVKMLETAYRLDPLQPRYVGNLGGAYFNAGREQDALEHWKKAVGIAPFQVYSDMSEYYLVKKDYDKATETIKKLQELRSTAPITLGRRGYLAAVTGDKNEAMKVIDQLEKITKEGSAQYLSLVGFIHYALGDMNTFIDYMRRAAELHALFAIDLRISPLYSKARGDPRLHKIFESVGIPLPTWD